MVVSGTSNVDMRSNNRAAVLHAINSGHAVSRKVLSQQLKLTAAALSNITGDLINEGVLVEGCVDDSNGKSGRKEILLELNRSHYYAFGAYIASRTVKVFCMDFNYQEKFMQELVFDDAASGEEMLNAILDVVDGYLAQIDLSKIQVVGIGIALKGITDSSNGISVNSFGLWENNLSVREIVSRRFPYRVVVNNNVKCIAYAESMLPENINADSLLLVKYGPLLGGSFVLNTDVYNGANYKAMELAHMVMDVNGVKCRCGKRGCAETIVGFDVLTHQLSMLYSPVRTPILYRLTQGDKSRIQMDTILESYSAGDPAVGDVMKRAIQYLALDIVNAAGLLNPSKVILYGKPFLNEGYIAALYAAIEELCNGEKVFDVVKSTRNLEEDYVSCIAIVIKEFLDSGAQL